MKEVKERSIRVKLTEEEWQNFKSLAECYNTNRARMLEQFIADLTASNNSGGSDERDIASSWCSRSRYNF